jgi:hypothetical protein
LIRTLRRAPLSKKTTFTGILLCLISEY